MDKLEENIKKNENKKRKHSPTPSNDIISEDKNNEDFIEPSRKVLIEEAPFGLINLCDELMLEILSYLDPRSLLKAAETCIRMQTLVRDQRLWRHIDLTNEQLRLREVKKTLVNTSVHTRSIKIRGLVEEFPQDIWKHATFSDSLLDHITESCENLEALELHHCYINNDTIDIVDFPKKLKRLIFVDCYVKWPNAPVVLFSKIDSHLTQLEELRFEFCNWFNTHDLVAFSKVSSLKRLSIKGCNNLKEFMPYGSLAARFGFKNLEQLDLRETPITDSDLQCFNTLPNLKQLLIECPVELRNKPPAASSLASTSSGRRVGDSIRRRPHAERPSNTVQPGRFFIVNFYMNPNVPGQGEGGRDRVLPIPHMHELHPGSAHEQIENALRTVLGRESGNDGDPRRRRTASIYFAPAKITDRGICSYGTPRVPVLNNVVCIRAEPRPPDTNIEKLILRHYRFITDVSLRHLVQCAPKLRFIDLTGTGVTEEGVNIFKIEKPDCFVISDFTV